MREWFLYGFKRIVNKKEDREMSTRKTDTTERRTSLLARRLMSGGITLAVLAAVIFSVNLITRADEIQPDGGVMATSTDAPGIADNSDGIVKGDDGNFYYYVDGELYNNPGWYSADTMDVYIDAYGHVTMSYDKTGMVLSVYQEGEQRISGRTVQVMSDGYAYAFDDDGVKVSVQGWYSVDSNNRYQIDENGRAVKFYSRTDSIIRMYSYAVDNAQWIAYTSTWQSVDAKAYYFNATGVCTKIYDSNTQKSSVLNSERRLVLARKQLLILEDGNTYYFDGNGSRVNKTGWYLTAGNGSVYVSGSGAVTSKIYKSGAVYRLYSYNSSQNKWYIVKNVWKTAGQRLFYFNGTGAGTVLYDSKSKVLYKYSMKYKAYRRATNTIDKLNGTRYYFYNKNGVRVTSGGWKKAGSTLYYVRKNSYVTSRYTDVKGTKKLYDYDYSKKKWVQKKNTWRTVGDNKYYFGSKGIAAISYNTKTHKAYVYSKNKWKAVKLSIQKVGNSNFYFDKNGKRVTKAGVYKTSNGYLAYVNGRGIVYKKEYDLSVKRYYKIDLGKGKTTKVYGYYELGDARKLMALVNQHRIDNGLAPLTISTSLTETATTRAKEISNRYSHYRPNGTLCINSMYELYGENLACGFSEEDLVFRAWSKSYAHDSNMLNTTYKTMGAAVFVALDKDKEGFKMYYVLTFGK